MKKIVGQKKVLLIIFEEASTRSRNCLISKFRDILALYLEIERTEKNDYEK